MCLKLHRKVSVRLGAVRTPATIFSFHSSTLLRLALPDPNWNVFVMGQKAIRQYFNIAAWNSCC